MDLVPRAGLDEAIIKGLAIISGNVRVGQASPGGARFCGKGVQGGGINAAAKMVGVWALWPRTKARKASPHPGGIPLVARRAPRATKLQRRDGVGGTRLDPALTLGAMNRFQVSRVRPRGVRGGPWSYWRIGWWR